MSEKKVFIAFTNLDTDQIKHSEHAAVQKILQKGTTVPLYVQQDLKTEAGSGNLGGQLLWDAARENNFIVADFDNGGDMYIIETDSQTELGEATARAMEVAGRKLLAVIMNKDQAIFYGLGIERGGRLEKIIPATSIAPTIAYIADFPLPAHVEAAVAYSVIKGLNFKMKEVQKLNETIASMMASMERTVRQPWDKHDCA